jgi:DNA-binding NarL/FixJ family response regulator
MRERDELEEVLVLSQQMHSRLWISLVTAALASVQITLGETAAAESLLAGALTVETSRHTVGQRQSAGQRLLWVARAELALVQDKPQQALAILDQLYAGTCDLRREADVPLLALRKAAALTASGKPQHAITLLREAQITARDQGTLPTLRTLQLALADLLRRELGVEAARDDEAAAREVASRLAATLLPGELREEYLRAAGLEPSGAEPASGDPHDVLTGREREVAMQIAAGLSNRAIAEQLFVSARTVEAHVSNILRKLGLSSRAGIATWVARQGNPEATT